MRILFCVPYVPRPEMSGTLRNYFLLAGLARRHDVRMVVATRDQSFWTAADVERIRGLVQKLTIHDLSVPPTHALRRALNFAASSLDRSTPPWWLDPRFVATLRAEIAEFHPDVIFAEGPAALHCHALREVPVVVDFCDAHALRIDPLRSGWVEAWRRRAGIASREAFVASFAQWTTAITERDADAVRAPRERVAVVPNGVDLEHYVPRPGPWQANSLAFVGAMDYAPNADAALYLAGEVWPLIRAAEPAAQLFIVGRRPGAQVTALGGREGITVTGTVDDVRPYVWRSAASIAPLRNASGLQNKVIQSLAMGVPMVVTPAANAGLGAGEDEGVVVGETPAALAEAALAIMRDPARREMLGANGRKFVLEHYRWEHAVAVLEQVLERAIARHRALARASAARPGGR